MGAIQLEMDFDTGQSVLPTIRSVDYNQESIMENIMRLYGIREISLDITYSIGNFYKSGRIPQPKIKMDVCPQTVDTIKLEPLQAIPMGDESCECVVYDPPFVVSPKDSPSMTTEAKDGSVVIQKRFASFYPLDELTETYYFHMKEFYRILKEGGFAIVKCQNVISGGKQINSPEYLWLIGESLGFDMIDKFVLVAKQRLISGKVKTQQHSRRYESYFLVFKKDVSKKPKYLTFQRGGGGKSDFGFI